MKSNPLPTEPIRKSFLLVAVALLGACLWAGYSFWTKQRREKAQSIEQSAGATAARPSNLEKPRDADPAVTEEPQPSATVPLPPAIVAPAPLRSANAGAVVAAAAPTRPQPSAYTRQLVSALTNLDLAHGPITPEKAAEWKRNLQLLQQQGAEAVPAIREFLERNLDWDLTPANGGNQLGASSLRTAMLDALQSIGGPEALALSADVLQTTSDPKEIALLARNLMQQAPDQYRDAALAAAREALAMAAAGKLDGRDVGPLFAVLQQYGGAGVVADLEKATSQWRYYSAIALGNLPDGAGVPSLVQMVEDPNGSTKSGRTAALQVLAQVAPQFPEASAALIEQTRLNQIPNATWINIGEVLAGQSFQIGTLPADNTSLAGSNPKSYHLSYGNQSFYSVSGSVPLAPDQISQRVALIDQLLAVNQNPAAADVLQRARASLVSRQ